MKTCISSRKKKLMKVEVKNNEDRYIQEVYLVNETPRLAYAVINVNEKYPKHAYIGTSGIYFEHNGAQVHFTELGDVAPNDIRVTGETDRYSLNVMIYDYGLLEELCVSDTYTPLYQAPDEEEEDEEVEE
jgi:hypothetical protein